ncbi:unnamed protein product [Rotaria sordida]|uniref:Uncharacterized protein n=1 Tax=Rotaria sordida TaxID=392033 RepID=A0A818SN08_9BILA|nr:unnamed protein product [Rotaria sordida]CAF3673444.1 unnamed protein product [Rotaria sordida]
MSKLILSYLFKTNLAEFRSAILDDNTDRICRILDIERDYLYRQIDSHGNTALLLAIKYASPLTVHLLLEQGAQSDQSNQTTFQTPLALIASKVYDDYHSHKAKKKLEMAKILLDYGASVDILTSHTYKDEVGQDYSSKETPLMTAVRKGNLPLATLLIERKANVNYIERHSEMRPIHYAIANGNEPMFDLLENAGGLYTSLVINSGNTLLHWFCCKKENDEHINLLNKLIEKGCDINAKNSHGQTPLMFAVKHNMINTCRILLENGVDIDECDCTGNQAIDLSIPGSECSRLLLQAANNRKSKSSNQSSQSSESKSKIVYTRRITNKRRSTAESSEINFDTTIDQCISCSSPNEEKEEKKSISSHLNIYPIRRTNSEDITPKYDYIWEKLRRRCEKRRESRNLSRQTDLTYMEAKSTL